MLESLLDRLRNHPWSKAFLDLPPARRTLVLGGGAFVFLSLFSVGWWASRPRYVVLLTGADYGVVTQVTDHLQEAGIDHVISPGGSEIRVRERDYARARVLLAKTNLASGRPVTPGLELFDKPHWGITDFAERVNYRRALEGELERTISRMSGVRSATVHITLSERSPFRRTEREATASVALELAPGVALDREAIQAITYLVSSSVENLPPERVTILDMHGRLLSAPIHDGPFAAADRQLDYRRAVERDLTQKILDLLEDVVGPENVRVQVSAEIDFNRVQRRSESYDPDRQAVLSEQRSEVIAAPGAAVVPQDPVLANASTLFGLAPGTNAETTNYQNTRSVENLEKATGTLSRLSVAVLVNDRALADQQSDRAAALAYIEDLVRGAVGYDARRGDQLVVRAVAFGTPGTLWSPRPVWYDLLERYSRELLGGIALVFAILFGLLVLRILRSSVKAQVEASESELDQALESAFEPEPEPLVEIEHESSEDEKIYLSVVHEARTRFEDNPETAIRLILSWVREP